MKKNKNFAMDDMTHRRLKTYAAMHGLSIGVAITTLLDFQQIPAIRPGNGYREWLLKVIAVGDKEGPEAAEKYMKENPYVEG